MCLAGTSNSGSGSTGTDQQFPLKYPVGKTAPEIPSKSIEAPTSLPVKESGDTGTDQQSPLKYPVGKTAPEIPSKSIEAPTSQRAK